VAQVKKPSISFEASRAALHEGACAVVCARFRVLFEEAACMQTLWIK